MAGSGCEENVAQDMGIVGQSRQQPLNHHAYNLRIWRLLRTGHDFGWKAFL